MAQWEGTNGFVPVFIPWYADPTYRETAPANFELTPEEEKLVEKYGLDNDQLQWRRKKIAQNGLELTQQEYPAEPTEAFSIQVAQSLIRSSSPTCSMRPKIQSNASHWKATSGSRTGAVNNHIFQSRPRAVCHWGRSCYGHRVRRLFGRTLSMARKDKSQYGEDDAIRITSRPYSMLLGILQPSPHHRGK